MVKTKNDTNVSVAERRKQTKETEESSAEQLCMDNIPVGLNEFNDLLVSDSKEESL